MLYGVYEVVKVCLFFVVLFCIFYDFSVFFIFEDDLESIDVWYVNFKIKKFKFEGIVYYMFDYDNEWF